MNHSVRDLADRIAGDKAGAEGLVAGITASREQVKALLDQFRQLGIENAGPVPPLSSCESGIERAAATAQHVVEQLERCRFIAMSAISGVYGGGGTGTGTGDGVVTRAGDQTDDPATWERPTSGEELVEPPDLRRRGEGLAGFFGRNIDKVDDVAQTVGKQIDIAWDSVGHEPTPTSGVVTSSQVPSGPVIQPPPVEKPSSGSVFMAGFVLATLVTKSTQVASAAIKRARSKADE